MISLLIGTTLWLAAADAAPPDEALARQVAALVRQLDSVQLTERDAAEKELRELGPAVLPMLPAISDRTSAEVAKRLERLRQQLMREQATEATRASLVTLRGKKLPLAEVLAEIAKQTGNPISDHRADFGQQADPRHVDVDLDKTSFWQALDQVLDQAGLTLYGFAGERGAFVINRPPDAAPRAAQACYAGMFRLQPVRFEAQRDLRNEKLGGAAAVPRGQLGAADAAVFDLAAAGRRDGDGRLR